VSEGEGRGAMRESRAFEFLRMNQRQLKPRTVGLTKIATWRTSSRASAPTPTSSSLLARVVQPDAAQGAGRRDRTLSPEPGAVSTSGEPRSLVASPARLAA